MQFHQINTKSVADSVSEQVKSLILGGGLKPGEKLPSERTLSSEFNVSRMSLRQGIALLIEVGLLEARKDGTYVCDAISPSLVEPFSDLFTWYPQAFEDMLELRMLLETKAIELAMERRCESDTQVLNIFFERMQSAFANDNVSAILHSIKELHQAIIDCSYNLVLTSVLRGLLTLIRNNFDESLDQEQLGKLQFIQECLYRSIIQSDLDMAIDMLQKHNDIVRSFNQAFIQKQAENTVITVSDEPSHSINVDKTTARIEHLIICQYFEEGKSLPKTEELAKVVGENIDIVNKSLEALINKEVLTLKNKHYFISKHYAEPIISDPLAHLITANWKVALDVFELRLILERNSAQQASTNRDVDKRNYLKACLSRLLSNEEDYNAQSNALDDYEFHLAIADLSENLATTYLMRGLFNLLRSSISSWLSLFQEEVGDISIIQRQHINVCDAILDNQAEKASEAMQDHLQYVITTVKRIADRKERQVYSDMRLRYLEAKFPKR